MGAMTVSEGLSLDTVRAQEFPVVREYTYLNTASQGPWPTRTVRAVEQTAALAQFPNTPRAQNAPPGEPAARARLARLIGADEADLVFTANTSHGMNICAQGIDWRPGDNVVLPEREFPSLAYAWFHLRERGVEVRFVPFCGAGPSVDDVMAAVDGRTRVVACSAITWDTGYRADLAELGRQCTARGCLLIVDGIQIVGAQQIDVRALGIAALSTHGYKWLLAGFGVGALYIAPHALDQIRPTFIGVQSVVGDPDLFEDRLDWQPGAARFTAGGANRLGQAALAASLGLIEEVGSAAIEARGRELAEMLYAGLQRKGDSVRIVSSPDPARRAAIVAFTMGSRDGDAATVRRLEERGIIVALRPLGVRVSPHFYNTEDDIARLLDALS